MDAELVRAASMEVRFNECETIQALEHAPIGPRGAAVTSAGSHAGAAPKVARHRQFDSPGIQAQAAVEQSDVRFRHLAAPELLRQPLVRGVVPRDQQRAGRSSIEAMHNAGAQFATQFREPAKAVEQRAHQRSARSHCAGMNDHPRRLVYNGDVLIFIKNFQGDGFRQRLPRRRGRDANQNRLSRLNAVRALPWNAIHLDPSLVHEALQARSAQRREMGGQIAIEPLARFLIRNDQHTPGTGKIIDGSFFWHWKIARGDLSPGSDWFGLLLLLQAAVPQQGSDEDH